MIATVTANPCIDKTVSVDKFDVYKMNRATVLRTDVSGKGINVSYALKNLGEETTCLGIDFCEGKSIVKETLSGMGIKHDFIDVNGKLRTCTKIFDKSLLHTIELNEYGQSVNEKDGERLIEKIKARAREFDIITLSGSLPNGLSDDFYYRCVNEIRKANPNCKVAVDAEKKLLLKALEASPYFIKPNIFEFQSTFGCSVNSVSELDGEARKVMDKYGLKTICVSMGKDGAYIADDSHAYFSECAKVDVKSIQGAGDSMVAGICVAIKRDLELQEVLNYGVSAAGASVMLEGTQFCQKEDFEKILKCNRKVEKIR